MLPSGYDACLLIRRSRIQDPLWPPVKFDPGGLWLNFLAALKVVGVVVALCCLSFARRYWRV